MKTGTIKRCVVCAALLGAASAQATLFVSDSFEVGSGGYTAGGLTGQNVTVPGMNGAWLNSTGHTVSETGLTYGDANYVNGTGGSVVAPSSGVRTGRLLDTTYTDSSVGTVYLSVLMKMDNVDSSQYRALELHDGGFDDGANRMFQLGSHKSDMTTTNFGYRLENSASFKGELDTLNADVNLFVVKFEFSNVENSDVVTVWQNPDLSGAGDPAGGVTLTGADMSFDRITFARFHNTAGLAWDEVRMGDSFTDVIPEPATLGLISVFAGGLVAARRIFTI